MNKLYTYIYTFFTQQIVGWYIIITLMYCMTFLFPTIVYDPLLEYNRLQPYYSWLTTDIVYCIYNELSLYNTDITIDEICAIIQLESGSATHNDINKMKYAVSSAGAIGLMQVMPFHHKGNKTDLYNEFINIHYGIKYYVWCVQYTQGNRKEALRCYNAGPFSKTQYKGYKTYVAKILSHVYTTKLLYFNNPIYTIR